jgi:hypothetical protein
VTHDLEDGAWQFLSDDELAKPEAEARIVALHEILDLDSSLKVLGGLPVGYTASRMEKGDKWEI